MGKNTKMQQKLKIAEKEKASRPKKVYKGNRKKERLRKLRDGTLPCLIVGGGGRGGGGFKLHILGKKTFSSSSFNFYNRVT